MIRPLAPLQPLLCAPLLRRVDTRLLELLRSLAPLEWELPTVAPGWSVRDVAAHLLDTALRKLSMARDACFVENAAIRSPQDLVDFVNRLNREGVAVFHRLSPRILIGQLETACQESAGFHESLTPFAPSLFSVSWAGEKQSRNWFDTARELTERWHHQQQIRLATGRPGLMEPEFYHPVLDCFLRGLPYAYRNCPAAPGTEILICIEGDAGGQWLLVRQEEEWILAISPAHHAACSISIPPQIAWRLFTKSLRYEEAAPLIRVEGNPVLAEPLWRFVAIVG